MTITFRIRTWTATLAAALIAAALVSAQQGQQPTFRTTTDYVSTDVIVRDKTGRFIPNLKIDDFEVYEDGVRQTVTGFVRVIGGRTLTDITPTAVQVREGLILPPSPRPADESGRIFIIFIDDMHIQPSDSIKARRVLEQIRDTVIHDGDLIAIVSTGYSSIQVDSTYDFNRARFNESIDKLMGAGMTPQEIITASQTREGPAGLRHNAFVAFSTAYDMLAQAEKIPNRRKAFIYLSGGYDFNPFKNARFKAIQDMFAQPASDQRDPGVAGSGGDLSASDINRYRNPFEAGGQQFADADLAAAVWELTQAARRANVVFYTVDPRGLMAGPDINVQVSVDEWRSFASTTTDSLKSLGTETGGFCICDTNGFKAGLQRIDNEMSDYYVVGYTSTNPDPLRVVRRVEIKVTRADAANVIYRETYSIRRPK